MSIRKSHEDFIKEVNEINSNILVKGTYINAKTKIDVECLKCHHIWKITPSHLLSGRGCPSCKAIELGNRCRCSKENFIEKLSKINPNIEILSDYKNNRTKIKCLCKIDGNIWYANPDNLLKGHGCSKCANCYRRTHDEFIRDLHNVNKNISVLSNFKDTGTKIKCQCKIDKHIWDASPHYLLNGNGCPKCNESKGERRISNYLNKNGIDFESQKKFDELIGVGNGLLSYDFYLPQYNLLIEYQGEFHDGSIKNGYQSISKLEKQLVHDSRKRIFAHEHHIELLEIWYKDFDNIEIILQNKLNKLRK